MKQLGQVEQENRVCRRIRPHCAEQVLAASASAHRNRMDICQSEASQPSHCVCNDSCHVISGDSDHEPRLAGDSSCAFFQEAQQIQHRQDFAAMRADAEDECRHPGKWSQRSRANDLQNVLRSNSQVKIARSEAEVLAVRDCFGCAWPFRSGFKRALQRCGVQGDAVGKPLRWGSERDLLGGDEVE